MSANWKNRTLWTGDNLDIMRGMNSESVDLIYLDPPFNSNRDYAAPIGSEAAGAAFKDTWTLTDVDRAWHGEIADRHPALYAIIDAAGAAHGKGMKSYLIMMAVRLLEMQRILKTTGSIYLHCDPTASHYLKMLMDAIFGQEVHRCEITWKRTNTHNDAKHTFPKVADVILFYGRQDARFNPLYEPHSPEYVSKFYRHDDGDGRGPYQLADMASPNPRPKMMYDWKGYPHPPKGWRYQVERMTELDEQGRIYYPTSSDSEPDYSKRPRLKRYLHEQKGSLIGNVWTDILPVSPTSRESTRYPTQKPVALLDRIIRASSNEGDMVLDPFCGCATALVAADRLNRQWAGIDLSPLAARLVLKRLRDDRGPLFNDVIHRTDMPVRTDLGDLPDYRTHKHTLYGQQEGHCAGCLILFPFRNLTVDHIVAESKGGSDHIDNLQLLCGACNSVKGTRSHAELVAQLVKEGIRT